jgi:hypothetical protein
LAALTDDEKIILTALYDVACDRRLFARVRAGDALSVAELQELARWPGERTLGRQRVAAAARSLTAYSLATRTRTDVYRYRLDEAGWLAWGGRPVKRTGGGW